MLAIMSGKLMMETLILVLMEIAAPSILTAMNKMMTTEKQRKTAQTVWKIMITPREIVRIKLNK